MKDLPHNFQTHRESWRNAIVLAIKNAPPSTVDSDDRAYWIHELNAFDAAYNELNLITLTQKNVAAREAAQDDGYTTADLSKATTCFKANADRQYAPAAPTVNAGVVAWNECERIADLPLVDEALRNFAEDKTADNANCLVRVILESHIVENDDPAYDDAWVTGQWRRTLMLMDDTDTVTNALRIFGNRVLMQFGTYAGMRKAFSESYEFEKTGKVLAATVADDSSDFGMSKYEADVYHKLRITLERSENVGLYDVLLGADVRIRRLMSQAEKRDQAS